MSGLYTGAQYLCLGVELCVSSLFGWCKALSQRRQKEGRKTIMMWLIYILCFGYTLFPTGSGTGVVVLYLRVLLWEFVKPSGSWSQQAGAGPWRQTLRVSSSCFWFGFLFPGQSLPCKQCLQMSSPADRVVWTAVGTLHDMEVAIQKNPSSLLMLLRSDIRSQQWEK